MNTTAQIKQAAKKTAQQIAKEPLEILKSATRQVTGSESLSFDEKPQKTEKQTKDSEVSQDEINYKKQVAEQEGRKLQALEFELKDIRRQRIFNSLLQRIQGGEDVSIEEFSELSFEQKDVLKAQVEASKKQKEATSSQGNNLPEPSAKRGRQMGSGQRQSAQKQTTRVEKPVPPSG